MDPDVALTQIRTLAKEIGELAALADVARLTRDQKEVLQADSVELAEAVTALDEWLTGGGFKPAAWATSNH